MSEMELTEERELLIGTWIGVALLADKLIEHGTVSKEELLRPLSQIEEAACDNRRTALAGLRLLISRGFKCTPDSAPAKGMAAPRRSIDCGPERPACWGPRLSHGIRSTPRFHRCNKRRVALVPRKHEGSTYFAEHLCRDDREK